MKKSLLLMFLGTMSFLPSLVVANVKTSGRTNSELYSELPFFSATENNFAQKYKLAKQELERSNHIGIIDKLMIARFIQENGKVVLLEAINKHIFEEIRENEVPSGSFTMVFHPFCIVHRFYKGDESLLAKEISIEIYNHEILEMARITQNPLNQYNDCRMIDECSSYKHYIVEIHPSIEVKEVTACFYNKKALLRAIEEL